MKVEDAAVVVRPDPRRVPRMGEPDVRAGAEHRIRDFPGMAIEEQKAGLLSEDLVPKVEQHRGARVFPTPRITGALACDNQRRCRIAIRRQLPGAERLALRPSPVAMAIFRRSAIDEDAAVELQK